MATADELLAGAMTEVEQVLTINWETRTIDIPKTISNLGVESDDEVKHLKFSAPRYYHGTDLSTFKVRINYLNANQEGDMYEPKDVTVTTDSIKFTWIVGRFATMYKGDVEFNVCMVILDAEGVIDKEVNTTPSILPVLKGLETVPALMEEERDAMTAAVLDALERAQSTDLKGEPGYTPVKGEDYYTEDERNEFRDSIVFDANGQFGNTLKGTARGTVVRVDDVMPVPHTQKIRVRGKNLANPYGFEIGKSISGAGPGATIDIIDNTAMATNEIIAVSGNAKYIFTLDNTVYFLDRICEMNEYGICTFNHAFYFTPETNDRDSFIWTTKPETKYLAVRLKNKNGTTPTYEEIEAINLMVTEYVDANSGVYEPFIEPSNVTVYRAGKNIIPSIQKSHKVNGLTIGPYEDGRIVISGSIDGTEPTGIAYLTPSAVDIPLHKNVPYKLSLYHNEELYTGTIGMRVTYTDTGTVAWNTLGDSTKDRVLNYVYLFHNDLAVGSQKLGGYWKLQLEVGDTVTAWEPCHAIPGTGELVGFYPDGSGYIDFTAENGAPIAPTMTLMTDTPGVTIEVDYSKDINKASFGGGAGVNPDGIVLKDRVTGKEYTVYISDGKLMME